MTNFSDFPNWSSFILKIESKAELKAHFQLEDNGVGKTRFIHEENFSGLLVPLLWKRLDTDTRAGFARFNNALKSRVELRKAALT